MKKICFYVDNIYTLGGIQRIVTDMANKLKDKYDITIINQYFIKDDKRCNYNLDKKIKVKTISNDFFFLDKIIFAPLRIIRYLIIHFKLSNNVAKSILNYDYKIFKKIKLINLINDEKYDYVLAEGLYNCIYMSKLRNRINSKIIGCWHSSYYNYIKDYNELDIINSLSTIETIVLTKYDSKLIKEKYGIDVKYIYNFISSEPVKTSTLNNKNFIAVGRYHNVKGFDRLIRNFSKLSNKDWNLLIVGEGLERKKLQSIINDLKLNDSTDNIDDYYRQGGIFLLSSYGEGFPMVVLEAMKYGLPIIAYDIPVLHEMLPNDDYIVDQNDDKSYIHLMEKLCNNEELRNKVGADNSKKCEDFYDYLIIKRWISLLK